MQRIILLFVLFMGVLSANTLQVGEEEFYRLLPIYEYSDENLDKEEFWREEHHYVKSKEALKTATYQPYLIHFRLHNNTNHAREYLLVSERGYTFSLDYYLVKDGKLTLHDSDGFFSRASSSPFRSSHRVFPLNIESNESLDIYFKVENCNRVDIPFHLMSYRYLAEYNISYHLFQGLFFATLLIMALYNMVIYFITKHKSYLYYIAYSLLLVLYQGSYFGYLHLLTNIGVKTIYMLMIISSIGFIIALIYFLCQLFVFPQKIQKIFSFLVAVFYFAMGGLLISNWLEIHFWVESFFNVINFTIPIYAGLVLYALYSLVFKKRNYLALLYAVGWSILAFFGLLLILTHIGFLSTDLGVEYLFEGAMMVESLLLAVFLAYRIKEIEREQQNQQVLLLRQSRLASMGEMINMIAHQWRQPLAVINGVVMNLDIDFRKDRLTESKFNSYLDEIESLTSYLSKTIEEFMNFFSTKKEKQRFNLYEVFDEMRGIIAQRLKEIDLQINIDKDIEIEGYRRELLQVVLIVVNNAIDALNSGGNKVDFDPKIIVNSEKREECIHLYIENNGGAIKEEILRRVFDPYFTTKHQSQGTGLGLYILKMIVEQSMLGEAKIYNKTKRSVVVEIALPKHLK
jgi:signal transduction histidine kinase